MKPVRPCIERGCPELTLGTRCKVHQQEWERRHRQRVARGELTGSRGSTWEWLQVRAQRLRMDGYRCQICGRSKGDLLRPEVISKRGWLEVHHVDRDPGNNDLSNLITLCSHCHKTVHKGD